MERVKTESEYNMIDWWKKAFLQNYANFEGRARRSEYWYFILFNFIISFTAWIASFILFFIGGFLLWFFIGAFSLAIIIPKLAVQVRRLHDTGKSGWWIFICLIPVIGAIALLVFNLTEGDRGANEYGPDPKQISDSTINEIGKNY
ncbi:DUF805 domain-containing protein [Pseudotenacibaculum sp. MALMAid0570]|uniref:DUF805 domain-containing protein n=1 Tax=Pseudotenacibaculum sp. MALMAid0570 TaxID=3143938 RepID=UPI0032DEC7DC